MKNIFWHDVYIAPDVAFPAHLIKTQGDAIRLGYIRLTAEINATQILFSAVKNKN